jgi:hypothetical protein
VCFGFGLWDALHIGCGGCNKQCIGFFAGWLLYGLGSRKVYVSKVSSKD